jgi:hypothetical protein
MKGEGWEYQPVDFSSQNTNLDEFDEQLSDPVGYGTKYGYGVVRGYDLGQEQSATAFVDPNTEYVNSLSTDEMDSYNVSLYGRAPEAAVGDEEVAPLPLEQQGCYGQAQAEVYGDSPLADVDVSARLDELTTDAQNDPKILDAYDAWAACMTERDGSYEFATPDEIYNYLYDKLAAAQGFGDQAASGFVRGVNPGDTLPEVDQGAIEALRAEEMQIWTDDQACQVETDIPGSLCVGGDEHYLGIILQNLLETARKYNRPGGRIRIAATVEGQDVVVRVGNTGRGIPPASQAHIFERFHRGGVGENVPGYGLGLNLARELARLHRGELRLLGSGDDWTEFECRLPAVPARSPSETARV